MIIKEIFGQVNGEPAHSWRLSSKSAVSIRVTDYGARLTELYVPDREGQTADIVLGFDDAESYAASPTYFGATVGRYGNRISRGKFNLLGTDYQVDCNEKLNHLQHELEVLSSCGNRVLVFLTVKRHSLLDLIHFYFNPSREVLLKKMLFNLLT